LTVIFSQPLVPGFDETKLTFYYPKWMLNPEESPDDLDKNHQVKVDAHLVM
jgi:hypothetical protein